MVDFIEYDGTKLPFRLDYAALALASGELGGFDKIDNMANHHIVFWYGLVAGHKFAKKELNIKREDAIWVLDTCYDKFLSAMVYYTQSLTEASKAAVQPNKKK